MYNTVQTHSCILAHKTRGGAGPGLREGGVTMTTQYCVEVPPL